MLIPVVLLLFATLAAGVMAYGTHAEWAQYPWGYDFIIFARRVQWPMAVASLGLCLGVLGLIVSGRRRAWWLIGLAPVGALFVHRFVSHPSDQFHVIEGPTFVAADEAVKFVNDEDYVVGLRFADHDYAYPYAALFHTPVVIHAEHDQRLLVMWSAYANRAMAFRISRDLRGPDLQVVSMPANALLVYNARLGEFINGVTSRTPKGNTPTGFREAVATTKTTWKTWRTLHPQTRLLGPTHAGYASAPRGPLRPAFPMPKQIAATDARVVLVGDRQLVPMRELGDASRPMNISAGDLPVLLFRDPRDGTPRALRREVDDLRPKFRANADPRRRPKAVFIDEDTGTGWDLDGVAVDGPKEFRGKKLAPVSVDDDLPEDVMRHWYPNLAPAR